MSTAETAEASPRRRPRADAARLPLRWAAASRTKEGELYRRVVRQLRAHVGGKPSATEELLIARIAWLQVHLAHIDERAMRDGALSPHATREYLAWAGALARMLSTLGMKSSPAPVPSLSDYMAGKRAREAAQVPSGGAGEP